MDNNLTAFTITSEDNLAINSQVMFAKDEESAKHIIGHIYGVDVSIVKRN